MYHIAKDFPLKNFIFRIRQIQTIGIKSKKPWRYLDSEDFLKEKREILLKEEDGFLLQKNFAGYWWKISDKAKVVHNPPLAAAYRDDY